MKRTLLPLGLSLFFCLFPVQAAIHVWTGASSAAFSDAANWIGGSPAGDADAELSFPAGTPRLEATNDIVSLTVKTITFSGTGYTIGGNAITLTDGAEVLDATDGPNELACNLVLANGATFFASSSQIVSGSEGTLTLSGVIGGMGPVVKLGHGTVRISGAAPNVYSGATRVLNGVLQLMKNDGVAAIPGELEISSTGVNDEKGSVVVSSPEQIADTAPLRVSADLIVIARETLGPIVIDGAARISTRYGGASIGTIILDGDVRLEEATPFSSANFDGDIRLNGMRTITTCDKCPPLDLDEVAGETPDAGLTIRGGAARPLSVQIHGTYAGPTIVEDANVSVFDPSTTVRMRGGRIRGKFRTLVSEWGIVDLTSRELTTTGDIRLSPSTFVDVEFSGTEMHAGGVLDLAAATLRIDDVLNPGATALIIANDGTGPVRGTFRGIAEGDACEGRFRVSYRAGDGNDIAVTRTGRYPTEIHVTGNSRTTAGQPVTIQADITLQSATTPVRSGRVELRDGTNVVATTRPDVRGHVTLTTVPAWPRQTYTIAYISETELLGSLAEASVTVDAVTPQITSVEPASAIGGTVVSGIVHGTNFYEGGRIEVNHKTVPTTFVSANEVRFTWDTPRSDADVTATLVYVQPDSILSNAVPFTLEARALPPGNISAEARALTARVVPGGGAAWLGMFIANGAQRFRMAAVTPDSNHDGIARWELNGTVPQQALWIATDMADGTVSATRVQRAAPPLMPLPHAMFLRDAAGHYSHISITPASSATMLMWVRPGVGAWRTDSIGDGEAADLDGTANGRILFDVSQMRGAVDNVTLPPPAGVEPGDVFTGMDFEMTHWLGDHVDSHLHESDGPGVISFARIGPGVPSVGESAGVMRVTVMRVDGTDGAVSVDYATSDGTAHAGVQFAPVAGTLTFGPGELLKTIEVPIVDDNRYYGNTSFEIVLSNPAGTTIGGKTTFPIRITENDPAPHLLVPNVTVAEGDQPRGEAAVVVSLEFPTNTPLVAHWTFTEQPHGVAVNGGDLTFRPGGPMTQTVIVPYLGNRVPEDDRSIVVLVTVQSVGAEPQSSSGLLKIVDDDFAEVTILDASVSESADVAMVRISTTRGSNKVISLNYSTANGTATAGNDFADTSGSTTFTRTASGFLVTIPIIHDSTAEGPETFTVTLSNVKNARVIRDTATVVITDPDTSELPVLSATVTPGVEDSGMPVWLRLRLSRPAPENIEFWLSTQSGTATAAYDFAVIDQLITFPAGTTDHTLLVQIVTDQDENEGNETFTISLSQASGAVIATPLLTATIIDRAPDADAVAIEATNLTLIEGDARTTNAHFVVRLPSAAATTTTVRYATADASALASSDYIAASGTLTFAPGEQEQSVDVAIIGDRVYEPDEEFALVVGTTPIVCRIVNDDAPQPRHRAAN